MEKNYFLAVPSHPAEGDDKEVESSEDFFNGTMKTNFFVLDGDVDPEHRSYHDDYSPYAVGRNHIKVYRGKSSPVKGHHDDHYGGDYYFAPWGYHATLTPDAHHKYGGYH